MEILRHFFSSDGFMPHGFCYLWNPALVWLHLVSDVLIALSYLSIPITLVYFVRKRRDLPFHWMFVCFGIFIVACGATHVMEIWNIWHAAYWLAGAVKAVTALASVPTAILLVQLIPKALALPGPSDLERINLALSNRADELAHANQAIQASEEKFRSLAETANDAILSANSQGNIVYFNGAAEQMFRYPAGEVIGQPLTLLMPERYRHAHTQGFERFLRTGEARVIGKTVEMAGLRKDGSEFPAQISLSTWRTREGVFFTAILSDMTHRKKGEEKFKALLESAPDAMIIVNREGRIELINAQTEKLFGYTREELLGKGMDILVPERFRGRHGGHREGFFRSPKTREMGAGLELYGLRKNGTEFPVEISLSPLETPEGALVSSAIRDITTRKKAEDKFRALLQSAPDAMVIVNKDGEIVLVNSQTEQLFGYSAEELLDKKVEILIPDRYRGRHPTHRGGFFADPKLRPMGAGLELFARRKDGTEFPVEISLSPLETEDGVLVSSAIRDVTERKKAEEALARQRNELAQSNAELAAANTELEAFSYSISHDLRAPLRGIDGFSQALLEDYSDRLDGNGKQHLERVRTAAQRMAALIDDLLALSRITRAEIQRQPVDLSEMARSVVQDLSRQDPVRKVEFVIAPGLQAEADVRLMRTVLENLLGNAWKFTSRCPQARIEFGRTHANGLSPFFVRDNGAGFDPAYASRLFGAFQRLHAAAEFPGTGVGLASVQRIIHRHGGRVWGMSAVNQGATFFFTLLGDTMASERNESERHRSTNQIANSLAE